MCYGKFDYLIQIKYCIYKIDGFKESTIQPGLYYVESDNYMPLRGNGWYYHNMIVIVLIWTLLNLRISNMSLNLPYHFQNVIIINSLITVINIENYSKLAIY